MLCFVLRAYMGQDEPGNNDFFNFGGISNSILVRGPSLSNKVLGEVPLTFLLLHQKLSKAPWWLLNHWSPAFNRKPGTASVFKSVIHNCV